MGKDLEGRDLISKILEEQVFIYILEEFKKVMKFKLYNTN